MTTERQDRTAAQGRIECDGGPYCQASPHIHGCFADKGDCDHPSEHPAAQDRRRRLSALAARMMLAREMWARYHGVEDYTAWDDNTMASSIYERWIERADALIREEMERV